LKQNKSDSAVKMEKSKILLYAKSTLSAQKIIKLLEASNYTVTSVVSRLRDIYPKIIEDKPNLILLDTKFAQNKLKIAQQISERFNLPVVFLISKSDKKAVEEAEAAKHHNFLFKPFNKNELETSIKAALSAPPTKERQKKRIEQPDQSRRIENQYRLIVENINEGIVVQNEKGIITYVNKKFLEMMGYDEQEVLGKPITQFLGEGLLKKDKEQKFGRKKPWEKTWEFSWRRKDGKRIYTILSPKLIYDEEGHFKGSVAVLTDNTAQRLVERELRRSREQLRKLSYHLQSVREKESRRIAGEIHDELGQLLTALKIDISWLGRRIPKTNEEREKYYEKIKSMEKLVDQTIETVQKISSELRPGLLDDLGLIPALEWLGQDFQKRTGINCQTEFRCRKSEFEPDLSTAIFRISQEALTNVSRHAKATQVNILLKEERGMLKLEIHDNGQGIKEEEIYSPFSLGLMGMRERIRPLGGELKIESSSEGGTALLINIPLKMY